MRHNPGKPTKSVELLVGLRFRELADPTPFGPSIKGEGGHILNIASSGYSLLTARPAGRRSSGPNDPSVT